ncbi:hypothetical protein AX016_2539 [Cellulophaga sp. RHA19]|nr:hypothetical protein AX016_2539 [Cellulophaga sp. RHA19]
MYGYFENFEIVYDIIQLLPTAVLCTVLFII